MRVISKLMAIMSLTCGLLCTTGFVSAKGAVCSTDAHCIQKHTCNADQHAYCDSNGPEKECACKPNLN